MTGAIKHKDMILLLEVMDNCNSISLQATNTRNNLNPYFEVPPLISKHIFQICSIFTFHNLPLSIDHKVRHKPDTINLIYEHLPLLGSHKIKCCQV